MFARFLLFEKFGFFNDGLLPSSLLLLATFAAAFAAAAAFAVLKFATFLLKFVKRFAAFSAAFAFAAAFSFRNNDTAAFSFRYVLALLYFSSIFLLSSRLCLIIRFFICFRLLL